jgi:hypothetical protein
VLQIVNLESPDKNNKNDLIVLHPNWLCNRLIGDLLSHDRSPKSKVNGQLSATDVSSIVDVTDFAKLTKVLEALDLCVSGAGLLEFPCFNTLPLPLTSGKYPQIFPCMEELESSLHDLKPANSWPVSSLEFKCSCTDDLSLKWTRGETGPRCAWAGSSVWLPWRRPIR